VSSEEEESNKLFSSTRGKNTINKEYIKNLNECTNENQW